MIRHFRFRLATLLLFVGVVCCYLGWVVHQANRRHVIIATIIELGGQVFYETDWDESCVQLWGIFTPTTESSRIALDTKVPFIRLLKNQECPSNVVGVSLPNSSASDEIVSKLAVFCHLEALTLFDTGTRDVSIAQLMRLESLRVLDVRNSNFTDRELKVLSDFLPDCKINTGELILGPVVIESDHTLFTEPSIPSELTHGTIIFDEKIVPEAKEE